MSAVKAANEAAGIRRAATAFSHAMEMMVAAVDAGNESRAAIKAAGEFGSNKALAAAVVLGEAASALITIAADDLVAAGKVVRS